jgi:hypothetical protein
VRVCSVVLADILGHMLKAKYLSYKLSEYCFDKLLHEAKYVQDVVGVRARVKWCDAYSAGKTSLPLCRCQGARADAAARPRGPKARHQAADGEAFSAPTPWPAPGPVQGARGQVGKAGMVEGILELRGAAGLFVVMHRPLGRGISPPGKVMVLWAMGQLLRWEEALALWEVREVLNGVCRVVGCGRGGWGGRPPHSSLHRE